MNRNETLERIKVKMKEKNPSIKDVEFVAKRDPINFGAITYSVFINGEKSQDRLLGELIDDLEFVGCHYAPINEKRIDVVEELATLLCNVYDSSEFK
jgi:hypothetical protein